MTTSANVVAPASTFGGFTPRLFTAGILIACLFLQRFGLAFGEQAMNGVGPIGLVLGFYGVAQGTLSFDRRRLMAYVFLVCWSMAGIAIHAAWPSAYSVAPSTNSLIQFLVLTSFLTLTFTEAMDETAFFKQVNNYFAIVAGAGVLQFVAQLVGINVFSFEGLVPGFILVEFGWNQQILAGVGSLMKSNGFFLQEPSIFSQVMALALIIEVLAFKRSRYLVLFMAGLFLSFSGTGWIVLTAFVAGLGLSLGLRGLLLAMAVVIVLGSTLAVILVLSPDTAGALEARTGEIFLPMTSGHLRFVTPFWVLSDVMERVPSALAIGLGPGVSEKLAMPYLYNVNTPIKITLEFGLPAFIAYLLLFVLGERTALQRAIVLPAIVLVMFAGAYAQFPPLLFLVALLICTARLRSAKA